MLGDAPALEGVTEHFGMPLFRRGEGVLRELERVEERHGLGPELTQFLRTRPCLLHFPRSEDYMIIRVLFSHFMYVG